MTDAVSDGVEMRLSGRTLEETVVEALQCFVVLSAYTDHTTTSAVQLLQLDLRHTNDALFTVANSAEDLSFSPHCMSGQLNVYIVHFTVANGTNILRLKTALKQVFNARLHCSGVGRGPRGLGPNRPCTKFFG